MEDTDMNHLKELVAMEAKYRLRPEVMDRFLSGGTVIALDTYEPMIDAGVYDPNVYIVKSGLVRGTYMDKNIEKTAGFALAGTLLISFHCFYGDEGSYYRFEACCPTEVLRIPKEHFDSLLAGSHEFALWVMSAHQNQLYYNESKNNVLSGDAKSRLIQLTHRLSAIVDEKDRPRVESIDDNVHSKMVKTELFTRWKEIFRIVPSKIIASYLGITEQHLSKIKRELLIGK